MAHPVCLFFNYEDLAESFLKKLMYVASNMLSCREAEREIKDGEVRGRLISQYEAGFYGNFAGTVFYGELFSKSKSYRIILLIGNENLEDNKRGGLSILKADSHEQIAEILKHMEIINSN